MAKFVEVLDSVMGSFKSQRTIEWIDANPNEKYLFVSPLLTEVQEGGRLCSAVNNVTFECPSISEYDTKSEHLLKLLEDGVNIACTHSLYLAVTDKHLDLIERRGYILIIDEEIDVINGVDGYSKDDYSWLYENNKISVAKNDGMVSWICNIDVGIDNKYYVFKKLCDYQALYVTKRDSSMMVTQLPIKLMTKAKRVIILTYLFKGNILDCFLKLKGIEVKEFTDVKVEKRCGDEIRKLITLIPPNDKLSKYSLSSTWYEEANKKQLDDVAKYISNVCRTQKALFDDVMYTLPKGRHVGSSTKNLVKPPKYYRKRENGEWKHCWLATQTRATNDYKHKWCVVHVYNRFPMVSVASYLSDYGCPVDQQTFSRSEMVQWIWRSRIRSMQPITVAIGSKRMYKIFSEWLKEL